MRNWVDIRETLKDNLLQALNRVDDIRELAFPDLPKDIRRSKKGDILDNQESRESDEEQVAGIEIEKIKNQKGRTPKKKSDRRVRFININGRRYRFDYVWQKLDSDIAKEAYLDKNKSTIMVILNSGYNLLNVIKPDWLYHAFYLTEGIIEVFLKENEKSFNKLIFLRDKLIKQLADIISEDIEENAKRRDSRAIAAQTYLLENRHKKNNEDDKLNDNEKEVLGLRLEKGLHFQKIALYMNLSRQRAHQLYSSALRKINKDTGLKEQKPKKALKKTLKKSFDSKYSDIGIDAKQIDQILSVVAERYNIRLEDLLGKSRKKELVFPRHLAAYLLREKLSLSFPQIAKILGKKDHTSTMYAYRKIKELIRER